METIVLINIFATVALLFYAVMQHEELDRHEKAIRHLADLALLAGSDPRWLEQSRKDIDDILNGKH